MVTMGFITCFLQSEGRGMGRWWPLFLIGGDGNETSIEHHHVGENPLLCIRWRTRYPLLPSFSAFVFFFVVEL